VAGAGVPVAAAGVPVDSRLIEIKYAFKVTSCPYSRFASALFAI
jgi:hypothetical protein